MKLWAALYLTIWIVLLEVLLGLWPNPPVVVPYLHLVLGLGVVPITYYLFAGLRRTRVPARVKRVARASFALSVFMVFLGFLLWFRVGASWTVPIGGISAYQVILVFHVVTAMAILTQMAACAIAYDMWEDHEFEKETSPGEVPAPTTTR